MLAPARINPWYSLSKRQILQRQVDQLARYLRNTVLPHNAWYRERYARAGFHPDQLRTPDDLRRIPFLSKEDFTSPGSARKIVLVPNVSSAAALTGERSAFLGSLFDVFRFPNGGEARATALRQSLKDEYRPLLMTSTTGRSADPVSFVYTARDIAILKIAGERILRTCAALPEQQMMNLFPFAPHLAFWLAHYAGVSFGAMMVSTGGGKGMGTAGNLEILRRVRPDVLLGIPTFLYHFMNLAAEAGERLPNLVKIIVGGEKAPAGMQRKLLECAHALGAENVEILCTYGFTEAKMAWAECPHPVDEPSAGYHISPELSLIEIVDPDTGEPLPEGQPGEIVFTPLESRGSVALRFRTGDLIDGGLHFGLCPYCRRNVPRLVGNISRRADIHSLRLEKLKGTLVDFNVLEHLLDECELIRDWQLELRKRYDDPYGIDEIILHVNRYEDASEEAVLRELDHLLPAKLEIRANRVIFHSEAELRRLHSADAGIKECRVVDHRPPQSDQTNHHTPADSGTDHPTEPATQHHV